MENNLGNKEIMARNIQRFMLLNDKDRKQICNDLGIRYTTFTDWVKGNTYPRIDKIEMLARYFNISKADLVEEYVESGPTGATVLSSDECALLSDYQKLNELGKEKARIDVADLTEIPKYTEKERSDSGVMAG